MDITNFKQEFQPYLDSFLEQKYGFYKTLSDDTFILDIIGYTKNVIGTTGKRIRPYVGYLMYKASEGIEDKEALRILVSIELFHNFALIHDDIIDQAELRHGVPTTHRYVAGQLEKLKRIADYEHLGESQAILVGDFLHAWSQEIIYKNTFFSQDRLIEIQKCLGLMFDEVIMGEMMDVDAMTRESISDEFLYQKTLLKTATYTFVRPMQFGALLAKTDTSLMQFCEHFGTALGMAFQIQDDLLDLTQTSEHKKTVFLDLKERQHTYFTQHIQKNGTKKEKEVLQSLFGKTLKESDAEKVKNLFEQSGAFEYGRKKMQEYFNQASNILHSSPLSAQYRKDFSDLIAFIQNRTS